MRSKYYDFSDQKKHKGADIVDKYFAGCRKSSTDAKRQIILNTQMIDDVPLTDIHVHLPGTIHPEAAWALGVKNGFLSIINDSSAPSGKNWSNGPASLSIDSPYEHYSDIFLSTTGSKITLDKNGDPLNLKYSIDSESFKSFDRVLATIQGHRHPPGGVQNEDDINFVFAEYLKSCISQNVIYSELQQNIRIAHTLYPHLSQKDARLKFYNLLSEQVKNFRCNGVHIRFLHCFNKTQIANIGSSGHERALEAYDWLLEAHSEFPGLFVGVESAGHEKDTSGWPIHLQAGYNKVCELGLGCEAHGGEGIGVEHMLDVVQTLPITRLAHGFQAIEDIETILEIKKRNITLIMMPFMNIKLGAHIHGRIDENGIIYPLAKSLGGERIQVTLAQHPFFELLRGHDIKIAIASDNPELGGKSIKDSIRALAGLTEEYNGEFLPLSGEELYRCCINAIACAFCEGEVKSIYKNKLNEWAQKYNIQTSNSTI